MGLVRGLTTGVGARLLKGSAAIGGIALLVQGLATQGKKTKMVNEVVVPAQSNHSATLIFLHGLGDQGDGWADAFKHECRHAHIKYICPSSDSRPVTLNMGMRMPAWFDLYSLSADSQEDAEGIEQATRLVHSIIDREAASGTPTERILLGGFSMGGALALYAGLTYPRKLAGIIGLSSFLVQREKLPGAHTANLSTPIFLGHGTDDFLVPLSFGRLTEQKIKTFNPNVMLHTYRGVAHSSSDEEMRDLKSFIGERVPQN